MTCIQTDKNVFFYCLLLLVSLVTETTISCRTARKAIVARPVVQDTLASLPPTVPVHDEIDEASRLYERVLANHIDFKTFSAKAKIDLENDKGKQQGLNVSLRVQKDSVIWVSVNFSFLEVARAIVTRDSVKVINKLKKEVYLRSLDNIEDLVNIPFNFNTLQELIIGNPVYFTSAIRDISRSSSVISFVCETDQFINTIDVYADDYSLQECKLVDKDTLRNRYCELTYGNYQNINNRNFPSKRKIFVEDKGVTQLFLDFKKAEFDQPLSFPFSIGNGYIYK